MVSWQGMRAFAIKNVISERDDRIQIAWHSPVLWIFFKVFSKIIGAQTDDCTTKNEILDFSKFFRLKELPIFWNQQVPSQHQNGSDNYSKEGTQQYPRVVCNDFAGSFIPEMFIARFF